MAKSPKPPPSAPIVARRRGRPPKPGGRIPQVEVQRAYRARLASAGKVVRIVDAAAADPAAPRVALAPVPDVDPVTQLICDRATFADMRDRLHNALLELELREQDVERLEQRNAYLEGELKLQEQYLTNALKDNIVPKSNWRRCRPSCARAAGRLDRTLRYLADEDGDDPAIPAAVRRAAAPRS
jgi:hypothetical protein